MTSVTLVSSTKWICTFCRVVMWPQPREYVSARWPMRSSCSGVMRAGGQLDAHHLVGAALALAVDAVVQAHHPEHVFADLAGQVLGDGTLEPLDVALLFGIEIAGCRDDRCDAHVATSFDLDLG